MTRADMACGPWRSIEALPPISDEPLAVSGSDGIVLRSRRGVTPPCWLRPSRGIVDDGDDDAEVVAMEAGRSVMRPILDGGEARGSSLAVRSARPGSVPAG